MPTAYELQKERVKQIEDMANALLDRCAVMSIASVNENGFPRICTIAKKLAKDFHDIYFVSGKRSNVNGKIAHFEKNNKASVCYTLGADSVTLIGTIEFITDRALQESLLGEGDKPFFKSGVEDPKFRLIKFHTLEATFWIEGKFRTCKYK